MKRLMTVVKGRKKQNQDQQVIQQQFQEQKPQLYYTAFPNSPSDVRRPFEVEGTPINLIHTIPRKKLPERPGNENPRNGEWYSPQVNEDQARQIAQQKAREERERRIAEQKAKDEQAKRIAEQQRREKAAQLSAKAREENEAKRKEEERRENASAKNIRYLRGLVREKYRLDLLVWSQREVMLDDRDEVKEDYDRADRLLNEISSAFREWGEDVFEAEGWQVAHMIRDIMDNTKDDRTPWSERPPWTREECFEN